jgi:SAM-dependent methyltransferase
MRTGLIGGRLGYGLLRWITAHTRTERGCDGRAYRDRSKLEVLFGPRIWAEVEGKVVIDFGCGTGSDAIDIALHGARRVVGIDIRESVLTLARSAAMNAGVADRCFFTTSTQEQADLIVSVDGFEHYEDPEKELRVMRCLLKDDGHVLVVFGPPWFHPLGGHLFSVFPWAHLVFTEAALIRWRSDFKFDGATRFGEVEGGLNQMTVRRFQTLVEESDFAVEQVEPVPIRRLRLLANPLTREFLTSVVRSRLVPRQRSPVSVC